MGQASHPVGFDFKEIEGASALGIATTPAQARGLGGSVAQRVSNLFKPQDQETRELRVQTDPTTSIGWDHTNSRWQYPVSPFLGPDLRTLKCADKMAAWKLTWQNNVSGIEPTLDCGRTRAENGKSEERTSEQVPA